MVYLRASGVANMFFFGPRKKKASEKAREAEAIKSDILHKMDEASELIAETSKALSDPTLQIYYATRRKKERKS